MSLFSSTTQAVPEIGDIPRHVAIIILDAAIASYRGRERRFGRTGEQLILDRAPKTQAASADTPLRGQGQDA